MILCSAIGIDDMFVMINVWRKTNPQLPVEQRMALTYREGAVSIMLTRLTDVVVFMVGIWSPFPAVRIFCIHCCTAITVVFFFQLSLFGACMGLDGRREGAGRHCITMRIVEEKSERYFCRLMRKDELPKWMYGRWLIGLFLSDCRPPVTRVAESHFFL